MDCDEPLLAFRAGRCSFDQATGKVTSDPTKGLVRLLQKDDLLTVQWQNRSHDSIRTELHISNSNRAEFKRVPQCGDGRAFLIKISAPASLHFFWMQETDCSGDNDIFDVLESLINLPMNIDSAGSQPEEAPAEPVPSEATAQTCNIDVEGLSRAYQTVSNAPRYPPVSALLRPDVIGPVLQSAAIHDDLWNSLRHLLPDEDQDVSSLLAIIRTPHVQGQARVFESMIDSGDIHQVMANFGIQNSNDPSIVFARDAFIASLLSTARAPSPEKK